MVGTTNPIEILHPTDASLPDNYTMVRLGCPVEPILPVCYCSSEKCAACGRLVCRREAGPDAHTDRRYAHAMS
jgi:hypothetical protein